MRRKSIALALAGTMLAAAILSGCSNTTSDDASGSASSPADEEASSPEETPTETEAPAETEASTEEAETMAISDEYGWTYTEVQNGYYNSACEWEQDSPDAQPQLVSMPEYTVGTVIYHHDFEVDNGNSTYDSNSYNYATASTTTEFAHSGKYSYKVSSRASSITDANGYNTSGAGVRAAWEDTPNGIDSTELTGHKVLVDFWIMYTDVYYNGKMITELDDQVDFAYWCRVNQKENVDSTGYCFIGTQTIDKNTWTHVQFEVSCTDDINNGMIFLVGTYNDTDNNGYVTTYYLDDITLTIME